MEGITLYSKVLNELKVYYGIRNGVELSPDEEGRGLYAYFHEDVPVTSQFSKQGIRLFIGFQMQEAGNVVRYPVIDENSIRVSSASSYVPFLPNWDMNGSYGGPVIRDSRQIVAARPSRQYLLTLREVIDTLQLVLKQECVFGQKPYIKNRNAWLWYQTKGRK